MNILLDELVDSLKKSMPQNKFIVFLLSLKSQSYGINENQEFLKNKYNDIMKYYLEKQKNETKENQN